MRTAKRRNDTIFCLLATGALMTACAHDADHDGEGATLRTENGTTIPASLDPTSAPKHAVTVHESRLGPVDRAASRTAWKDGVSRFDNGDYAGAVGQLKLAVAGEPGDAYRRYLLGLAQWRSNDLGSAEISLVESAGLDATRVKTWINLARVRNARNDRAGALEASDKALELTPISAEALHQKGRALSELGRRDEAMDALKSAHDLDPDNGYIANSLGLLLIQTGRPAEALEPLEVAKVRLPHIAYVRNNLGVAYERAGRMNEAKLEYAAAVDAGDMGGKAMKSLVRLGASDTTGMPEISVAASAVPPADSK